MADENTSPTLESAEDITPANCTGELKPLPGIPGTTFTRYQCVDCGAVVHVGQDDPIPTEHARPE